MRPIILVLIGSTLAAPGLEPAALRPYGDEGVPGEFRRALALVERKPREAARLLDELRPRYPLLADYCLYHAARAHWAAGRADLAHARATRVAPDSVLDAEARLLAADALRALRRDDEARRAYRAYLERYPHGMRLPEVYFRLGDYPRSYVLGTGTAWEARAREKFDPATLDAAARGERGRRLLDLHRNGEAERALRDALAAPGRSPALECDLRYHLADAVFDQRDRTRAEPLFREAIAACDRAGNADLRVKARYNLGRCLLNLARPAEAAAAFAEIQREPHSYADDGLLREAESWIDAGEPARALERLQALPERFPDGDMKDEALWRIARQAIFERRWSDALAALDRAAAATARETDFWAEGRTFYWRGRVLWTLGRRDQARASLERAVREYPLTFYALLAMHRLAAWAPEQARALEHELLAPIPATAPPLRFADRPAFATPGFRRALELFRLGLGKDARRELDAAGARPGGSDEDLLWVAAVLYDRAGQWRQAHWIPRHTLTGYKVFWPHGENAARWWLSYPRGYGELIAREARAARVPEALFFAIVREESAFDPAIESWANAIGLTQMILPTAKRFAREPRKVTPERLRDPEFNVPIGARFLGMLWSRYRERPILSVAGYNAGEGAVDRWLKARAPDVELDEFVERIPYDQTRRYTKRVLSSYFAYHALYAPAGAGRVPPLPLAP